MASAGVLVAGCMGPTYGTDKPVGTQLVEDVTDLVSLGSTNKEKIDYKPRPELVKPADTSVLPPPAQQVEVASNPDWPESPDQRRARIQAAAYAGDPDQPVPAHYMAATGEGPQPTLTREEQEDRKRFNEGDPLSPDQLKSGGAEFQKRIQEMRQGSATERKYLSEPPTTYRQPAASAPVGDPGVDEDVKAAERKAGGKETLGTKLKKLWPL
ncbi:hypothetical protein SMD10_01135 [Consotaella sp. CSK11QG-6]